MVKVVKTNSWGSRIINAFWSILIGFVLIIGAFILIFWNEGHSLHTAQSLTEVEHIIITVPTSPIDPQNNLKVIYLTGEATTNDVLKDNLLNISEKAINLDRKVEMYQWEENSETSTEKNMGGSETETTNYTYKTAWSSDIIDSSHFQEQPGHQNPTTMPIKSSNQYAKDVTVGDFHLPKDLITEINASTNIDLSTIDTSKLQSKLNKPIKASDENIYVGENPQSPQVGDLKITVTKVLPQIVSIIAQQSGNRLQPYIAKAGKSVSLLAIGEQSPQQMILDAKSSNKIMTWILRLASALMLIFGIALLLNILSVLADVIPFLGSIVGFGVGLFAFVTGLTLWAIATGIAWFTVRPLFALGLIAIVVICCFLIVYWKKSRTLVQ